MNNPVLKNLVFGPSKIVAEETMDAIKKTGAGLLIAIFFCITVAELH